MADTHTGAAPGDDADGATTGDRSLTLVGAVRDPLATELARSICPLSLSVDHRVVDGAVAARFTNRVTEALATPRRLLVA